MQTTFVQETNSTLQTMINGKMNRVQSSKNWSKVKEKKELSLQHELSEAKQASEKSM